MLPDYHGNTTTHLQILIFVTNVPEPTTKSRVASGLGYKGILNEQVLRGFIEADPTRGHYVPYHAYTKTPQLHPSELCTIVHVRKEPT